jgi:hypothetical protein
MVALSKRACIDVALRRGGFLIRLPTHFGEQKKAVMKTTGTVDQLTADKGEITHDLEGLGIGRLLGQHVKIVAAANRHRSDTHDVV